MDKHIREFVNILSKTFEFPDPIWEIGSYLVPGQEELADLRGFFAGREFVGIDMREGPGVDRIENIEKINAPDESVGSILCLNTLEHVQNIFAAMSEMRRVLKPNGVLIVTTPFNFMIHDYPGDYWRFSPQALEYLTSSFAVRIIGYHGYKLSPRMTFCAAFKQDNTAEVENKLETLKEQFRRAAEPKKPHLDRRIKLAVAKRLAGERFFRDRDHFGDVDLWLYASRMRIPASETVTSCRKATCPRTNGKIQS